MEKVTQGKSKPQPPYICKHGVPKDAIWGCDACYEEVFPKKRIGVGAGSEAGLREAAIRDAALGRFNAILELCSHAVCAGDDCVRCAIGELADEAIRALKGKP